VSITRAPLRWYHSFWLGAVLFAYVAFLFLMPPMQTNDEPSHWNRLWSVATGHLTCGEIPAAARDFVAAVNYSGVRDQHQPFRLQRLEDGRLLEGRNSMVRAGGNACVYIPVAYVLPALAVVPLVHPYDRRSPAGMLTAYYVARATNVAVLTIAVLLFLLAFPELRNLTLVLYSLPMTIQQGSVYNQEATILALGFAVLYLWHARSRVAQVLMLLVAISLLAAMKSVYLVLLLLWGGAVFRYSRVEPRPSKTKLICLSALGLLPVVIQYFWSSLVVSQSGREFLPGWGVDPAGQLVFLREHPGHYLLVLWRQLLDLFGRGHMNGGWISVLGVLGWADFEIGDAAYYSLALAVVMAVVADVFTPAPAREIEGPSLSPVRRGLLLHALPLVSFFLIIPAVSTAMYFVFSGVGTPYILGVQGRYLQLPYFGILAFLILWLRLRLARRASPLVFPELARMALISMSMSLCGFGIYAAFHAVLEKYYRA
jgi:uncharacterized membrane protein